MWGLRFTGGAALMGDVVDAGADLALGSRCIPCGRPGRALCRRCAAELARAPFTAHPQWPSPTPAGLVTPWAATEYAGDIRELIVAHKEHGHLALARPLGKILATSVAAIVAAQPGAGEKGPVVLIPMPSRRAAVIVRGYDATLALTRSAARHLRRAGVEVRVSPALRMSRGVLDQAGLTRDQRAANLRAGVVRTPWRLIPDGQVVLCDDVITTGASARAAQAALEACGANPVAIAVIAATQRRAARHTRASINETQPKNRPRTLSSSPPED